MHSVRVSMLERSIMKTTLLPCLFLGALFLQVEARYRLEVRVRSYSNPLNHDFNGNCCDNFCSNNCDVYFIFCLRQYQYDPQLSSFPCDYGTENTNGHTLSISERIFTIGQPIAGAGSVINPLVFTGNSWPGEFQFATVVRDDDTDADDLLDRVIVDRTLGVSSSFSSVTRLGFYGVVTMQFEFRVMCESDYYGSDCTVRCTSRDDAMGHYSCDSNGNRVCLDGYSGVDCLTAECSPDCVQGTCSQPGLCDICDSGWSGPLCDMCDLAQGCAADRATCDMPGQCNCNTGYSGSLCQNDNDVCGHQAPCLNGGTCGNNGPNAYICTCPGLFTGTDCEMEVDMCESSPCQNGATCENSLGSFTCTCGAGWTGSSCETNIDECALSSSLCQNGGTCADCDPIVGPITTQTTNSGDTSPCVLGYRCTCPEGFFGDNCEVDVDYCMSSPCENGGLCHDIVGGVGYSCICLSGFTGVDCEDDIDECAEGVCQNGATCTNSFGSFSCSCPLGFNGSFCEINIDDCLSSPCNALNTQECQDGVNTYVCVCTSGFTGQNCEEEEDQCETFPCENGGTCTPSFNDFLCTCPLGFTGPRCSINIDDCHPDLCLFGGTCIDQVNDYICECTLGQSGRQCEVEVDLCSPALSSCPQDMVCLRTTDGGFQCITCASNEAGCESNAMEQGGNGTRPGGSDPSDSIAGGVVGGLVLALLLVAILVVVCCCCCCCRRNRVDEKEYDVTEAPDHSQNNPLYFGASTILSSNGGSMTRYKPYLSDNTTYTPAASTPPQTLEHHYDYIPAQVENGTVRETSAAALASGSYSHLLDKPEPASVDKIPKKSDKSDEGAAKEAGVKENPYVMGPTNNAYVMGPSARARRDMYVVLPTPEEMQKERED